MVRATRRAGDSDDWYDYMLKGVQWVREDIEEGRSRDALYDLEEIVIGNARELIAEIKADGIIPQKRLMNERSENE